MDALFTEEELRLRDAVDGQVDKVVPTSVQELEDFDDADLWSRLADGFLLGLGVPEPLGGLGSMVDATIAASSLAKAVAPTPYLGCAVLAGQLLARAEADPAVLEPMLAGRARNAVGFDRSLRRIAVLGRDEHILAFDSAGADAALVLDEGHSLVAIGVGEAVENLDLTRAVRRCLPELRVDLGTLGRTLSEHDLLGWTTAALVGISADLAGNMAGALRLAVEHASTRVQFGVAIGSFQALQHLIAEAFVSSDGARGLVNYAAWSLDHATPSEALRAATTAKAYCSESGKKVIEAVVQVHGGMGMTWDCLAHLYQRRVLTNRALLGDEAVHYAALAAG